MNATLTQIPSPVLVFGPAYCGKSTWAHQLLAPSTEAQVLGTAPETEPAFASRIAALRGIRPGAWESLSVGSDLSLALGQALSRKPPCPQILIDSISQWIAVLTLTLPSTSEADLESQITERAHEFLQVLERQKGTRIVLVSAEVGAGPSPSRPLERVYRRMVGMTNQKIAALSATVVSIQAGIPQFLKR